MLVETDIFISKMYIIDNDAHKCKRQVDIKEAHPKANIILCWKKMVFGLFITLRT